MTSAEIARIAQVSRSTVSRVVNQYSNVPEKTRQRVQDVIDQYGYTPNNSARILAGKTNNIIGIFLADICEAKEDSRWVGVNSPYNTEILSHFIQEGKRQGYLTLVDTISDLKECQEMETHFTNRMIYGGIFIGFPYRTKELEDMARKGYNVVLVDQLSDDDAKKTTVKRSNTDNELGGYLATKHLLDLGHRRVAHITGDERLSSYQRCSGYKKAMKEAGIKETITISGLYRENISYLESKKFLSSTEEKNLPTAFFAGNDIMALGLIRASEELGYRIPEDFSVVGFDNLQWSDWTNLNLTSIDASKTKLAKHAIDLLLEKETKPLVPPILVERGSTKAL